MAIDDFGEKIGGAKKDLWKDRGLNVNDLELMNDAEREKLITKDNVWKKPNYQELVDNGLHIRVTYFIKQIRDATPVRPVIPYVKDINTLKEKQEGYIEFVSDLRDNVMNLKTEEDVLNFYKSFMDKYLIRGESRYLVQISPLAYNCIDNKLLKASQVKSFYDIDREIKKKQFCYSPEQKILSQYEIIKLDSNRSEFTKDFNNRDMLVVSGNLIKRFIYLSEEFSNPEIWKENSFFILKEGKILKNNFENEDEAKKYILDNHTQKIEDKSKERRKKFIPEQLENITRNGEDYRKDKNITGEDMIKEFNFKGGEFGNWLNENDRQESLNYCYDALKDLSKALNIPANDISLNNSLSIAFGSRGAGTSPVAHYEPLREVINLTKMKGAGSLAHEWGHALDDALGKKLGLNGMATEKNLACIEIKELIDTMKYKTVCNEETLKMQIEKLEKDSTRIEKYINSFFPKEYLTEETSKKKDELIKEIIDKSNNATEKIVSRFYGNKKEDEIDKLSELRKECVGKVISAKDREQLLYMQNSINLSKNRIGKPEKLMTNFYKNSIEFDNMYSKTDNRYWQSNAELFARAFACYIKDNLDCRSDYLCGHSELAIGITVNKNNELDIIKAFPEGEERKCINQCIDKVIQLAKKKELMHEKNLEIEEIEI